MKSTLAVLGLAIILGPAFGQGVDPLIGTWKLNLEKSTFTSAAPPPKSLTTTWSGEGQNFIATTEGISGQGQPFKFVVQQIYDGMPHPVVGNPNFDATSLARVGNTVNIIRFKNGKPVSIGQSVTVPGKTTTLVAEGTNPNNQLFRDVLVYDRQ